VSALRADDCPKCGGQFTRESKRSTRVSIRNGDQWQHAPHEFVWTVECSAGHVYNVRLKTNVSPRWSLIASSAASSGEPS
jgi:hypothetical protein